MVNTRRSETLSEEQQHRHFSATVKQSSVEESSVYRGSSDADEPATSHEEESESWSPKWANNTNSVLSNRVRELRNRFVCDSKHNYSRRVRKTHMRPIRSSKRLVMDRQNRRDIYSRRNVIDDESEYLLDDLDGETPGFNLFTPRQRRTRRRIITKEGSCLVQAEEINYSGDSNQNRKSTRQMNSAKIIGEPLRSRSGLRPLKRESYADPNSPFSQELGNTSDEKPDIEIRRSKRQRKFKYSTFNTSWITEHQMIRGYPKFKRDFISDHEDDSKDSRIPDDVKQQKHEILSDLPLRQKRTCNSNKKYVYKFLSRNTSTQEIHQDRSQINGSGDSTQNSIDNSKNKSDGQDIGRTIVNGEALKEEVISHQDEQQNGAEDDSKLNKINSDSTPNKRNSRLRQRSAISYNLQEMEQNDSDSTTEERHSSPKYKLRQRKPKQLNPVVETREHRQRRELPRRRRRPIIRTKISDSSNDSTSSDDEIQRSKKHIAGVTSMQRHPNRRTNTPPREKNKVKAKNLTLDPTTIDSSITFKSIGGLDEQYRCLREMVILPMLYPEIFRMYHTNPPKGVLFYGPPGTGKTLMARALANECSIGNRKVTFFMRKGADLLSKWVGQTEKQMTLLFEQAAQMAPSIIFFDEIDGLAPARTARQEQVHVSVVASLLALMDGLDKTRNEVTVIGATNRLDALDPALRRPGRFDREIYFPLPSLTQRKEILKIILSDWPEIPSTNLIDDLAEKSIGYCGADLRALCTEAVLRSIRRTYPQIYESSHRLLIDHNKIKVNTNDFHKAGLALVPAGARGTPLHVASHPPSYLKPLLSNSIQTAINLVLHNFPSANKTLPSESLKAGGKCARLLIARNGSHLVASALLKEFEHLPVLNLDAITLHSRLTGTPEETCIQILNEARRNSPSILYLPKLNLWWEMANETVKILLQMMYTTYLTNTSSEMNSILLLATIDTSVTDFTNQISELFSEYRHEILEVDIPLEKDREAFFRPLIINESLEYNIPEELNITIINEPLPRAPTPPPPPLSPQSRQILFDKEEETLIELRIFLRDVCKKLASNKAFFMFTKPVDLEEVPDYLDVVEKPMDLETIMTKVDLHCYCSAQEFLIDIDLIQLNALTYNPDVTPADKQIRHRACWFRDYAYALIKAEMDTDFEDNCRKISKNRKARQTGEPNEFLPQHIRALAEESSIDTTPNKSKSILDQTDNQISENDAMDKQSLNITIADGIDKIESSNKNGALKICATQRISSHPHRKRRVPSWARGFLTGNKKKRKLCNRNVDVKVNHELEKNDQSHDVVAKTDDDVALLNHLELKEDQPAIITSPIQMERDSPPPSSTKSVGKTEKSININKQELNKILTRTVALTEGCSIEILGDLYMQLQLRIKKYFTTTNRQHLPHDLNEELDRFQKHYY